MNKFTKALLATAMLAGASMANAAPLVTDSTGTANTAFLEVYDPGQAKTYNLNLGITYNDLKTSPTAALAAAASRLASDGLWSTFKGNITAPGNVRYVLVAGSLAVPGGKAGEIFSTFQIALVPNVDRTVTLDSAALQIDNQAKRINNGLALANGTNGSVIGANSTIITDIPDDLTGQFNPQGSTADQLWGGWPSISVGSISNPVNFYFGGFRNVVIGTGGRPPRDILANVFEQQDVKLLGTLGLSLQNGLSFSPVSNVPLPAAVWMFGAGLMGVLRASRRKAA